MGGWCAAGPLPGSSHQHCKVVLPTSVGPPSTLCRYVAAMNAPGGGKNDIPNRLKRQFAIFHVPPPSTAAINDIFGSLMEGRFDRASFGEAVRAGAGSAGLQAGRRLEAGGSLQGHALAAEGAVQHQHLFPSITLMHVPAWPEPRPPFSPPTQVAEAARRLVPVTMALWNRVQAKMLPTPAKFHYQFSLRDLSKVRAVLWRGCTAAARSGGDVQLFLMGGARWQLPISRFIYMMCTICHAQTPAAFYHRSPPGRCSKASCWRSATGLQGAPLPARSPRPRATWWACGGTSASACLPTSWSAWRTRPGCRARWRRWCSRCGAGWGAERPAQGNGGGRQVWDVASSHWCIGMEARRGKGAASFTHLRYSCAPLPPQNFGAEMGQQLSEPLVFVDFLREPKRGRRAGHKECWW